MSISEKSAMSVRSRPASTELDNSRFLKFVARAEQRLSSQESTIILVPQAVGALLRFSLGQFKKTP